MELEFIKKGNVYVATGTAGKFSAYKETEGKRAGTWTLTLDGEEESTRLKKFSDCEEAAEELEEAADKASKKSSSKKTEKVAPKTAKKPAKAKDDEDEDDEDKKPARRSAKAAPVAAKKAKRVKPFPDFETWSEDEDNVAPKGRKESKEDYAKRLKGARLKWGKARAEYNRENDLDADSDTPAKSAKATPKAKKEPKSKEERFGDRWNDWGDAPDKMEYAIVLLNNARSSRDYAIAHGRLHPYSEAARGSYLSTVARVYTAERRVWELSENEELDIPKGTTFEYFNTQELPKGMFTGAPEGEEVLDGHTFEYLLNREKDKKGNWSNTEEITLPIKISKRNR